MSKEIANRVEKIALFKTAHDIYGFLDGESEFEVCLDAIEYIMSGECKNNLEKACIIDFCGRHGGITLTNARRFLPTGWFSQKTNRCGNVKCRLPGHQQKDCNPKFEKLSKEWGVA